MDSVLKLQGGTLNAYWERDGVAYDPGTVTVTIASARTGTNIVTGGATSGSGSGGRTYLLTPAQAANLDYLTVSWNAASDSSTLTTYAEIIQDNYFTIAQARLRSPLSDVTTYTTAQLLFYRILAEAAIDDVCGVSFVPRFSLEEVQIASWGMLEPSRRKIRSVQNIYTASDTGPVALTTLAGLRIESGGIVFMPAIWNWYSRPITMAYEHGYDFCPYRVSRAALELCRRWIVESPWDERTTGFRTRDGGEMTILTARTTAAGVTHPFDIPEVAAIADVYGTPMVA